MYRFINTDVPTLGCNLRCEYCYIKQHGDEEGVLKTNNNKALFDYSVEHMLRALSVERMGGVCVFHFTGSGETLLCPQLIEIIYGLLEAGHWISFTTNTTIRSEIDKIVAFPEDFRKRVFFKISFHYREMRRRNMLDGFVDNVQLLKQAGISYSLEIVSGDYLLDDIEEVKAFSLEKFGALPHVLTGRDEKNKGVAYHKEKSCLSDEEYNDVWSSFDSDLFNYQQWANEISHREEFCYAGVYTGTFFLKTGDFFSCPNTSKITNFFEDIEKPIQFVPVARACPFAFCFCGFFLHVLAGVNRNFDPGIYFHQFRDRICTDGSTWLTPPIRDLFSHRCSEYHESYSLRKQTFFDALMKKVHFDSENENNSMIGFIKQYCEDKGYRTVAMYGFGKIGKWLIPLFEGAGINVVYVIDRRAAEIICECECNLPVYSPNDNFPSVDAIIISVYSEFTAIAPPLREKMDIPIVSIINVADDL